MLAILLGLIASATFAEDDVEFYTSQFDNALTAVHRLSVLRIARDAELQDAGGFYAHALSRTLLSYPNLRSNREVDAADEAIRLITDELTEDQTDTGQNLWRVVEVFANPLVRADAVMALGKVGATDLLPQVVQLLKDTNENLYFRNPIAGERLAYGAIDALAKYKDASGYIPVFLAANGWYSERVKNKAAESLKEILEDPTDPLTEMVHGAGYTYAEKLLALTAIEQNEDVDEGAKASVALAALYEAWRGKGASNDARMRKELIRMRKLSIDMISRYGTEDESVYPLLERSFRYGVDVEEKLGAVAALKKLGTEDAAKLLSSFIDFINNKLERGIVTDTDERFMRALIPALGSTGNAAGRPVLRQVVALEWSYGVQQLAQEALENIGE
jgi:HEAT repeat protein